MNNIPLVDLKKQYQSIKSEVDEAIQNVIDQTAFIGGDYVTGFEKAFAEICGVSHGVGASSGTTALYLALLALGIGRGDEVITVPNTFIATTESISQTGAKVVFVDVDEKTYNIDVNQIEQAITKKTKAIIPIHLYGQPADMEAITKIARKHGLKVIEDASQAHCAEFNGKRIGSLSDVACFSFYPGKNLGAYGDAGMVVTDDEKLAEKVGKLSDHGRISKYEYEMEGFNYRLDALQAAILNVKLKHLENWTERRREIATSYDRLLKDAGIMTPFVDPRVRHVYHLYVIRIPQRNQVKDELAKQGIFAGIHYPVPLHWQPAYQYLKYQRGDFPVTEKCCQEILSLPIFPELSDEDVQRVVDAVKQQYSQKSRGADKNV